MASTRKSSVRDAERDRTARVRRARVVRRGVEIPTPRLVGEPSTERIDRSQSRITLTPQLITELRRVLPQVTGPSLVQWLGAIGLTIVALTHVAEAFNVFRGMRRGEPDSRSHYVNLASAIAAVILLPTGYGLRRRLHENTHGRISHRNV